MSLPLRVTAAAGPGESLSTQDPLSSSAPLQPGRGPGPPRGPEQRLLIGKAPMMADPKRDSGDSERNPFKLVMNGCVRKQRLLLGEGASQESRPSLNHFRRTRSPVDLKIIQMAVSKADKGSMRAGLGRAGPASLQEHTL